MMPLPAALGGAADLVGWRLDRSKYRADWDRGDGARSEGGRWNSIGRAAVYCSLDPSTTILEKAVHAGFAVLDAVPHVMSSFVVNAVSDVQIVTAADLPHAHWLHPGFPGADQQAFGDALLAAHTFVIIPSVVSRLSWNLVFDPARAAGKYTPRTQNMFALDARLRVPLPAASRQVPRRP
jgi:RES domain-containing protein